MPAEMWLQLAQTIGTTALVLVLMALYVWDKGRSDSKSENAIANVALSTTAQIGTLNKEVGECRYQLGIAEGKVTVLQDTLKTERLQWNIERRELAEKHDKLEKRIAELEHETKSKSELINDLKSQIEDRDERNLENVSKITELEEQLRDCQKEGEKVMKLPQPKQTKPKDDDDNQETKIA